MITRSISWYSLIPIRTVGYISQVTYLQALHERLHEEHLKAVQLILSVCYTATAVTNSRFPFSQYACISVLVHVVLQSEYEPVSLFTLISRPIWQRKGVNLPPTRKLRLCMAIDFLAWEGTQRTKYSCMVRASFPDPGDGGKELVGRNSYFHQSYVWDFHVMVVAFQWYRSWAESVPKCLPTWFFSPEHIAVNPVEWSKFLRLYGLPWS